MTKMPDPIDEVRDDGRPFSELRDEGLLWLINTAVFHPRGYALAIHFDDNEVATGWSLVGDGSEPWQMPDSPLIDELFAKTKEILG
jgi:hypothetical protein